MYNPCEKSSFWRVSPRNRGVIRWATFVLLMGLGGLPKRAAAQSIGTAIIEFGDRENNELTELNVFPVTGEECSAQTPITFEVGTIAQPVPTSRNELQFWRGNNCNEEARRVNSVDVVPCTNLDDPEGENENLISSSNDFTIRGTPIEITTPISNLVDCSAGGSTDNNIFILAVNQDGESTADLGENYALRVISSNLDPPNAPTGLEPENGRGGASVNVSWDRPSISLQEHRIYVEPDGCVAGEDGTLTPRTDGVLGATVGEAEPDTSLYDPFFVATVNGQASSATVDLSSVAIDQNAAIGVTAVDIESDAESGADVTCVLRVNTTGFCDQANCPEGCSCSSTKPPSLGSWWLVIGSLFLSTLRMKMISKRLRWKKEQCI